MLKRHGPPGLVDWEQKFPGLFQAYDPEVNLERVTRDAPETVRALVNAHCHGPFELYAIGHGIAIRERDKELAAQQPNFAANCADILMDHQEEVAAWLWPLIS